MDICYDDREVALAKINILIKTNYEGGEWKNSKLRISLLVL